MDFELSPELKELRTRVRTFMEERVIPREKELFDGALRGKRRSSPPFVRR